MRTSDNGGNGYFGQPPKYLTFQGDFCNMLFNFSSPLIQPYHVMATISLGVFCTSPDIPRFKTKKCWKIFILASDKRTKWQKRIIRCVLYLTRHPEVQAAAREEVEQVGLMLMVMAIVMVIRVPLIVVMVIVI